MVLTRMTALKRRTARTLAQSANSWQRLISRDRIYRLAPNNPYRS